ncbi:MAG: hypothetical protein HUJ96_09370 [Marinilabiliaceae bacterium]|nr:hypothetical protein [Marinilabiliaceae bacterium]
MSNINNDNKPSKDAIKISMASYVTPAGWIVAFALRLISNTYDKFSTFHLRQSLGLNILFVLLWVIFDKIGNWYLSQTASVIYIGCIIMGVTGAANSILRYQPLLGKIYNRLFRFIK